MKSKKAYPFVPTFTAMAVSILILLPLRIYQYFKILDPETGFYSKIDFSVYIMYAVMAFISIFSISAAFLNKKSLKFNGAALSPVSGIVAFALGGIGFVFDAMSCFKNYIAVNDGFNNIYDKTKWQYMSENGGIIILVEAVAAVLSAIYLFALATGFTSKKNVAPKLRLIALAMPVWGIAKLLMKFKIKISFVNVSDLFISLFAVAFAMLFFLYFTQTVSEVDNGETYFKMFAYGVPAAVFMLTCFVPRFLLSVIGREDLLCTGYSVEICDLLIPVMIITVLISRSYEPGKSSKRI